MNSSFPCLFPVAFCSRTKVEEGRGTADCTFLEAFANARDSLTTFDPESSWRMRSPEIPSTRHFTDFTNHRYKGSGSG